MCGFEKRGTPCLALGSLSQFPGKSKPLLNTQAQSFEPYQPRHYRGRRHSRFLQTRERNGLPVQRLANRLARHALFVEGVPKFGNQLWRAGRHLTV